MKNAKRKKEPVLKRLLPYAGRKKYLLYIAMLSSALSGILVLMPMVYIHKIVSGIILTGKIDPVSINHNAICAASFAVGGLLLYSFTLILSHIFAFEVEQNIISRNVKKLMAKPLGFFTNRESGNLRKTIVDGAAETHTMLAHQMPDIAMTMITPVVLLVFFFYFDWRLGLASMLPILISFRNNGLYDIQEKSENERRIFRRPVKTFSRDSRICTRHTCSQNFCTKH